MGFLGHTSQLTAPSLFLAVVGGSLATAGDPEQSQETHVLIINHH